MLICVVIALLQEGPIDVANLWLVAYILKKVSQLAFCGVISSISVSLLFISGFICILHYSTAVLAGVLITIAALVTDVKLSFLVYIVVSIVSLFTVLNKEVVFFYIFFGGIYPQILVLSHKIKNILFKFIFKTAAILILSLILNFVFLSLLTPSLKNSHNNLFIINLVFIFSIFALYDRFLHVFIKFHFPYIKNKFFKNI